MGRVRVITVEVSKAKTWNSFSFNRKQVFQVLHLGVRKDVDSPQGHNMKYFTIGVGLVFCLSTANLANADAIYNFSLPANGAVSAFDIQLTFPESTPGRRLLVFAVTSPEVTSLTFETPGFAPGSLSDRTADHSRVYLVRSCIGKRGGCAASFYLRFSWRLLCVQPYPSDYRNLLFRFWQRRERHCS